MLSADRSRSGVATRADAVDDQAGFDFAALRAREFARLDAAGHCYLDYTGSALYGASQLRAHMEQLQSGLFGNPHTQSATARASTVIIEDARDDVLRFFDVDARTHAVCFTANASAAIKLVAESYPFGARRALLLSADNHNSVNGVREYARRAGAAVHVLPLDAALELHDPESTLRAAAHHGSGLLAFPAQSNFSGLRHPLSLVHRARERGFDVLLDIAASAPSQSLSLRECPADFTVLSFYKLFGYPTGLGALVVRRDALRRLRRPWFAGGTVRYASVGADLHRLHDGEAGFEDGTPDFLGIAAIPAGFALLREVGMTRLHAHVSALIQELTGGLDALRHGNGAPLIRRYGTPDRGAPGSAVAFNVLDACGRVRPYGAVEAAAREAGISVRGGCFCNPGAAEAAFGADPAQLARCLHDLGVRFSPRRLSQCSGHAIGAVRASVGLASDRRDVARLIDCLQRFSSSR